MSEFDRVKHLLRRAARDGAAAPGTVRYASVETGVAHILETIEATVLTRRLTFTFGDGSRLLCDAGARQLRRLHAPPPQGLEPTQKALFETKTLGPDEMPALADMLMSLCKRSSTFTVTAEPGGLQTDTAQGGIDPAAIAAGLGLTKARPTDGDAHDAFLAAIEPALLAAILIGEDDASLICGEEPDADTLAQWAAASLTPLLAPEFPLLGSIETNGILVFTLPASANRHVLVAGKRGTFIVASVRGSDVAATISAWQATA